MVGVPRSKGCRICVQRRVRCDQSRPTCNNCKKGNRPCPGYGSDMKFQDEGPKLRKRYAKKVGAAESSDEDEDASANVADAGSWTFPIASAQPASPPDPFEIPNNMDPLLFDNRQVDEWGELDDLEMISQQYPDQDILNMDADEVFEHPDLALGRGYLAEFVKSATMENSGLGSKLGHVGLDFDSPLGWMSLYKQLYYPNIDRNQFYSPAMEQNQLFQNFTDNMSPLTAKSIPAYRYHGRWLSRLPDMTGNYPLLDTAIRAVTLAHLAMQTRSKVIMRESSPYYGRALHLLNKALADPAAGLASGTLSATILLSFYEMFSSDKLDSWVRHAGGAGTLMRLRGAARHRHGFDREMFLAYRHTILIESFEQDKPCFLDEAEWRRVADDIHEDIRTSGIANALDPVFDISEDFYREMIQIPSLCHDGRRLPALSIAGGGTHANIKADVIRRATQHRANMKSIFARFSAVLRQIGQAPVRRMTSDSADDVIPTRIDYFNIFIGSTHTGYWTILMIINAMLRELSAPSLTTSATAAAAAAAGTTADDLAFYKMENREAALDCCRSAEYMESSSFLGPFFIIFALRMAWMWLEPREEKMWIVRRLKRIGERNMSMAKGGLPAQQVDLGAHAAPVPKIRAAVEELGYLEGGRWSTTGSRSGSEEIGGKKGEGRMREVEMEMAVRSGGAR